MIIQTNHAHELGMFCPFGEMVVDILQGNFPPIVEVDGINHTNSFASSTIVLSVGTWNLDYVCSDGSMYNRQVIVGDATAPVMDCPNVWTILYTGLTSPSATHSLDFPSFFDNVDDVGLIVQTITVGGTLLMGGPLHQFTAGASNPTEFTVVYTATDTAGNAGTCVEHVILYDLPQPAAQDDCPPEQLDTLEVSTLDGEKYGRLRLFNTDIRDDDATSYTISVDGVVVSNGQLFDFHLSTQPGSEGRPRTYTIEYLKQVLNLDLTISRTLCKQKITVVDKEQPEFDCPADVTVETTGTIESGSGGVALDVDVTGFTPTVSFPILHKKMH